MAVPAGADNPDTKTDIVKSTENQNGKDKDDRDDEKSSSKFDDWCERFSINPNLLMLKVTLFVMYGATSCLLPYLTIHMQSIGLTVEEIAIVYLALPLTTFLSPPITGYLVDKMGHYKPVMVLTLVLNAVFHHALLLIPPMETPGVTPPAYVMRDPASGKVGVWWSPCRSRDCPDEEGAVNMVLDDCFDHCKLWEPQPTPPRKSILTAIHKGIAFRPPTFVAEKPSPEEKMKIPGPGGPNDDLHFNRPSGKRKPKNGTTMVKATTPPTNATEQHTLLVRLNLFPQSESDEEDQDTPEVFTSVFNRSILEENGINFTALLGEDLRCGGNMQATNVTYKTLNVITEDCLLQRCTFRDGGPEQCPPDFRESDDRIFWIYFVLRFLATIMLCGGVTLMDPIALSLIEEHGGEFGRERLSSNIGQAIFSPLTGLLIDYFSQRAGYTDYSSAFYAYDTLLLISAATILTMPRVNNPPADNLLTDLMKLIRLPHVIAFIFFLFLLGNFWGFIESFLFIYLKELDAPSWLLGFTVTVGTLSSIPFLWGAERITKRFGHVNIVVLAFFSHAVRLMGYSFIESAWWCFPFETIESVSVHLMWVAAATYCTVLAPRSLLATLIGVLGMAHFSLGRGSGSFFGGLIVSDVGPRKAFRIMGVVAILGGICYGVLQKFWLSKIAAKHEEKNKEEGTDPEAIKLNGDANAEANLITAEELRRASLERLTLMIQFNQRGSLTALNRGSSIDLRPREYNEMFRLSSRRRSSGSVRGSTSRVDLRKSTLEMRLQEARGSTPVLSTTFTQKGVTIPVNRKNIASISALSETPSRRDSIREEVEEPAEEHENAKPKLSKNSQPADKEI